jgi:hypothetical protein
MLVDHFKKLTYLTIPTLDAQMEKTGSKLSIASSHIMWTNIILPKCPRVSSPQTAEMHVKHHLKARP